MSDPHRWPLNREVWVREVSDAELLAVINDVARQCNEGSRLARIWSILWLSSRGNEGAEARMAEEAARNYGGFR